MSFRPAPSRPPEVAVIARSVRGLEWVAAAEIAGTVPGAGNIGMSPREVSFGLSGLTRELLALRTVDDVFLRVGALAEVGTTRDAPPLLARRLAGLDWTGCLARLAGIRPLPSRPVFDVVASVEGRRNYNRFAVENALGPALASLLHGTYLTRTAQGRAAPGNAAQGSAAQGSTAPGSTAPGSTAPGSTAQVSAAGGRAEPDLTVRVFLRGTDAIAAVRLADRPLHRRGYKQDTGPGTLHPPVAAALALLADPPFGATVADPFCGDGTIAIETARGYPDAHVMAGDIDPDRLDNARRNAGRAGVTIGFDRWDAGRLARPESGVDAILTNPPWNLAVDARGKLSRSLDGFWRRVPDLLTPSGRLCAVTDLELDAPARLAALDYRLGLATQIRLAGRVSHLLLAAPPGRPAPAVPAGLARFRRQAIEAGVVTEDGF